VWEQIASFRTVSITNYVAAILRKIPTNALILYVNTTPLALLHCYMFRPSCPPFQHCWKHGRSDFFESWVGWSAIVPGFQIRPVKDKALCPGPLSWWINQSWFHHRPDVHDELTASDVHFQLAELAFEVILQVRILNNLVTSFLPSCTIVTSRRGISNTDSLRITQVINYRTGCEIY
jgi:hypothetical protein